MFRDEDTRLGNIARGLKKYFTKPAKNILDLIKEKDCPPDVFRAFANIEINKILSKSFQITDRNRQYVTDFFQLLCQKLPDVVKTVLLDNIKYRDTPELNKILINFDLKIDIKDENHGTALFYALFRNQDLSLMLHLAQSAKSNLCVGKYKANNGLFDISLLEVAALCSCDEVFSFLATTFHDQIAKCLSNFARMLQDCDHIEMNGRSFSWLNISIAMERLIHYANTKKVEPYISREYIFRHVALSPSSIQDCLHSYEKLAKNLSFASSRCHCNSFFFWRRSYSEKTLELITTAQETLLKLVGDSKEDVKKLLDHPVFDPVHNQYGVDPEMRQMLMEKSHPLGSSVEVRKSN